jgi:sugar lactone lactonase YvrE
MHRTPVRYAKRCLYVLAALSLFFEAAGQTRPDFIYWCDYAGGDIRRANLDGTEQTTLAQRLNAPIGVALDLAGGQMYWADINGGDIRRANLDGSDVTTLISGLKSPNGLALDLAGGQMYWANFNGGDIWRANLDGSGVTTLVSGLNSPDILALDVADGKMYWTNFTLGGDIRRANLDGSGSEILVSGLNSPDGLALDFVGGKMYWTDFGAGDIRRANLDGSGSEILVSGLKSPAQQLKFNAQLVATVIPMQNCPSRRNGGPFKNDGQGFWNTDPTAPSFLARSDYACNSGWPVEARTNQIPYADLGDPNGPGPDSLVDGDKVSFWKVSPYDRRYMGVIYMRSQIRMSDITNGTSNSYMLEEKYLNPRDYFTGNDAADNQTLYVGADNDICRLTLLPPLRDTGVIKTGRASAVLTLAAATCCIAMAGSRSSLMMLIRPFTNGRVIGDEALSRDRESGVQCKEV